MALSTNPDDISRELQWLRNEFNGVKNIVNGWTAGGSLDPYFPYLRAAQAKFNQNPIESCSLSNPSTQAMLNNTWTVVNFSETDGETDEWGLSYTPRITPTSINKHSQFGVYLCAGYVSFQNNSSGARAIRLQDNVIIDVVARSPAATAVDTVLSFCVAIPAVTSDGPFFISAWQNSGGTLDLIDKQFYVGRLV